MTQRSKFNLGERNLLKNTLHSASLCYSASHTTCHAANLFRRLPSPIKKKNAFVRFAHAFFIFVHFTAVLVLSTTWNDLFYSCVDDASTWRKYFKFLFSNLKHSWQFNPGRKVSKHFASQTTWNNREIITENRSYIAPLRRRQQAQTKESKAEMLHEVLLH